MPTASTWHEHCPARSAMADEAWVIGAPACRGYDGSRWNERSTCDSFPTLRDSVSHVRPKVTSSGRADPGYLGE